MVSGGFYLQRGPKNVCYNLMVVMQYDGNKKELAMPFTDLTNIAGGWPLDEV